MTALAWILLAIVFVILAALVAAPMLIIARRDRDRADAMMRPFGDMPHIRDRW